MDKQSSKKPFFIMPEWAWAIVVGMFMLLLFLNHVIPGHAADEIPSPTVTPIPTSAIDPTDACLTIYIVGQTYMLFDEDSSTVYSYLLQYDNGLISRSELLDLAYFSRDYLPGNDNSAFFRDVKIALTQLKYQFTGFFVNLIDAWATLGAYESLYYAVSEVGVPISQDYGDYSTNRVLYMSNGIYIDVPIWVWNTAIPTPSPSPSPVPPQDQYVDLYVGAPWISTGSYFTQAGYYWLTFVTNDFDLDLPSTTNAFGFAYSSYNVFNPWKRSVLFSLSRGTDFLFYLYSDSISDIRIYFTGSAHYSDLNFVKENFSFVSFSGNDGWNFRNASYSGLTGFQFLSDSGSILSSSLFVHELGIISSWSNDSSEFNFNLNANSVNYPYVQALRFGLDGAYVPEPTPDPNQPSPSPTQAPLPTSGESIHVILPTGTPSPTPPFTVPGASDGSSGSDSPGSIGSGLSSGQTSGVLQAWNMYVSDNPAMLFLTSTFQSLPPELLYPLYILLFILLLLAVIRLFVHFSGG